MNAQEMSEATAVSKMPPVRAERGVPRGKETSAANTTIKEMETNQQWWWVAEKKRSKRLGRKALSMPRLCVIVCQYGIGLQTKPVLRRRGSG